MLRRLEALGSAASITKQACTTTKFSLISRNNSNRKSEMNRKEKSIEGLRA